MKGIQDAEHRIIGKVTTHQERVEEDKTKIKAAIFYSIASTQIGLQVPIPHFTLKIITALKH